MPGKILRHDEEKIMCFLIKTINEKKKIRINELKKYKIMTVQ